MDEQVQQSSQDTPQKNSTLPVVVLVLIILVLFGGYFLYQSKSSQSSQQKAVAGVSTQNSAMKTTHRNKMPAMSMSPMPSVPLTEQQQQELQDGTSSAKTEKTFDITGANFYFNPNKITVNKGDTVTIVFYDAGGVHNFNIDAFNVKIKTITTGKTGTATFVADKTGTFEYYCSIGLHRQLGQHGTLSVQ